MIDPCDMSAMRALARKRLPRMAFDFVDGGSGQEQTLLRNLRAFEEASVVPSLGLPLERVETSVELWGQTYAAPFGVAPMGMAGIVHPAADLILARCAARCGLPYLHSSTASNGLEAVTAVSDVAPWFQLYVPAHEDRVWDLIAKAKRVGCHVLVVTVDMPVVGLRKRDRRNRLNPRAPLVSLATSVLYPAWSLRRLIAGPLRFPNLAPDLDDEGPLNREEELRRQTGGYVNWSLIRKLRDRWPGVLLVKGILEPSVAADAVASGVDGVIVSNHGGRQLDCVPGALATLPSIAAQIGKSATILFDSGVRTGEDVLKVVDRGAIMSLIGRPLLYALGAFGERGVAAVLEHLLEETRRAFALSGRAHVRDVVDVAPEPDVAGSPGRSAIAVRSRDPVEPISAPLAFL